MLSCAARRFCYAADARTPLTVKRLGQQQRGCDDDNRAVPQVPSVSALAANDKCLASVHKHSERPLNIMLNMGPPRITDEMYARIPALLEGTTEER